jgi:hypothetical protein
MFIQPVEMEKQIAMRASPVSVGLDHVFLEVCVRNGLAAFKAVYIIR